MRNPEREGFEPSIPVSRYTAFPESVRGLTGLVCDRLLNANETTGPPATDWVRLPIGIGVGITRGLGIDGAPSHPLPDPVVTSLIAREAGEGTGLR
jgi:hypothetical protein